MLVDADQAPEFKPFKPEEFSETGIPWDKQDELGFFGALLETIKQIIAMPTDFFQRMPLEGGYGKPFLYGLILGTAGTVISQLWGMIMNTAGLTLPATILGMNSGADQMAGAAASSFASFILGVIMAPFGVALGILAGAGVLHLMLMIVGGANEGFETTFRCVSFVQTAQLAQMIPLVGPLVASIWAIVLQVIALRETHEISTGKALLAILLPTIICCCVVGFIALSFLGMLGAAGASGGLQ